MQKNRPTLISRILHTFNSNQKTRETQKLILVLAVSSFILVFTSFHIYQIQKEHAIKDVEKQLFFFATAKSQQIQAWRSDILSRATLFTESPFFSDAISKFMLKCTNEVKSKLKIRFTSIQKDLNFKDVKLVDTNGYIQLASNGENFKGKRIQPEILSLLRACFQSREPALTDLHEVDNDIRMDVIVPIYDLAAKNKTPVGGLLLQIDPDKFLYALLKTWHIDSVSAETILVRKENDNVIFLNDLRFKEKTALKFQIPLTQKDVPAVKAVLGFEEVIHALDYRNEEVIAATKAIPDSPWYLVVKIDKSEILQEWQSKSRFIFFSIFILIVSLISIAGLAWFRQSSRKSEALIKAQRQQIESEAQYKATLMSVGDGVIVTDFEGCITLMNPVAESLTGWTQEEARGEPITNVFCIVSEDNNRLVENPLVRVFKEGKIVGLANHTVLVSRDGYKYPVADSGAPIYGESGDIVGAVLVFRDQSSERKASRNLKNEVNRRQALLEAIPDIVMEVDAKKIYTWANREGLEFFGRDVLGKEASTYFSQVQDTYDTVQPIFDGKEDTIYVESWQRRIDGESRLLAWWSRGLTDSEGNVSGVISSARDLTEQKRLEKERHEMERRLAQAQKMEAVGALAGGIAHDFNNILAAVMGYTEMAMGDIPQDSAAVYDLEQVLHASKRARELVKQILSFTRQGEIQEKKPVNLRLVIEEAAKLLRPVIPSNIEILLDINAESTMIMADTGQMHQIIVNLCTNAAHAMRSSRGVLKLKLSEVALSENSECAQLAPGSYLKLVISDTGHGMDKETLLRIFDPYYTTKDVGEGSGIGLTVVHGIIERHGGAITVNSKVGYGTEFDIFLRKAESLEEIQEEKPDEPIIGGSECILYVDDEPALAMLGKRILKQLGYLVTATSNSEAALQIIKDHPEKFELVITDYAMPVLTGVDLSKEILKLRPDMPIILCTGHSENLNEVQAKEIGIREFSMKPLDIRQLARIVRKALDQNDGNAS